MCVMTPLCEFFPRFSVIYWTILATPAAAVSILYGTTVSQSRNQTFVPQHPEFRQLL